MDRREAEDIVSKLTPEQKIQLLRLIEILKANEEDRLIEILEAIEEGSVDVDND